jgi:arylformamidase
MKTDWIDITLPLGNDMPIYPGNDPAKGGPFRYPSFNRIFDGEKGHGVTMTQMEMNTHDGTHIDAPLHFVRGGSTIDKMPLDTTVGPCRVIEIKNSESITAAELEPYDIQPGDRILFKTNNSPRVYEKRAEAVDYVYVSVKAAHYLVEKKVRLVGIDYLTVGNDKTPGDNKEVHDTLLGAGIYIIEGINMDGVEPGKYELICLPLKLKNGDGCPCRAILRPL